MPVISSPAAFGSYELEINAKDSQIVGYKENISLPRILLIEIHTNPRCLRIYAIESPVFTNIIVVVVSNFIRKSNKPKAHVDTISIIHNDR